MKHEIETMWMGKMQFNALINGHTVVMDAPARAGGEDAGPSPKPFILSALSGCTGMDVVAVLRKQGIELQDLNIKVSGETSKQAPVEYIAAHIIYEMRGNDTDEAAALAAVMTSQQQLCGVSMMLRKIMPITWQVMYNDKEVFNNSVSTTVA